MLTYLLQYNNTLLSLYIERPIRKCAWIPYQLPEQTGQHQVNDIQHDPTSLPG